MLSLKSVLVPVCIRPLYLPGRQDFPLPTFQIHACFTKGFFHTQCRNFDHLLLMPLHGSKVERGWSDVDPHAL